MNRKENLKPLPNRGDNMCFGCSQENTMGLRMEFFTDEKSVFSWVKLPRHFCGWKDFAHGGIISTILDEVMGRSVSYEIKSLLMTKSVTVDFLRPVLIDTELRIEGRVLEIKSEREVLAEGLIFDEVGKLCARSTGIFSTFKADSSKKLSLDDGAVKSFETWLKKM